MATQKPISSVYVTDGMDGTWMEVVLHLQGLRNWSHMVLYNSGWKGAQEGGQPLAYRLSCTGNLCLPWCFYTSPSLGSALSLCLCPQHRFICLKDRYCSHLTRHCKKTPPTGFLVLSSKGHKFQEGGSAPTMGGDFSKGFSRGAEGYFHPAPWSGLVKEEAEQLQQLELPGSACLATPFLGKGI